MRDEPRSPTKHQLDHAVPTVIHHPEEDLPILARWLHRAMENQTRFWSLLVGLVVVVIGLTILVSGLSMGRAATNEAWTELEQAKTAAERVDIAQRFPNTPVERWALLQAATEFYSKGFADLPANREAASPELKKALEYFERVARSADKDSPEARAAALGVARTHEARNELEKAIRQYEYVAKTWPGTEEAEQSRRLAEALRRPDSVEFYKELYTYKPVETTLPPLGSGTLPLPPGHPSIGNFGSMLPPPPPGSSGMSGPGMTGPSPAGADLPADVFAPSPPPASPSAGTTKPEPEPQPKP